MPNQSNSTDLIPRGFEPTTLSTSPLFWNDPQWLPQEQFSWHTTEINTNTFNFYVRNMHIACLQPPEDITQRFSKLNRHISVIAYYKIFVSNSTNPKAKRQSTILSKPIHNQALTCRPKVLEQIPYVEVMKNSMYQQEFESSSYLKAL